MVWKSIYMNQNHLKSLCQHFNLGLPKQDPQRVYGGLLHIMWRVDTDKGSYAVKQLSHDIVPDERLSRISEGIALRFAARGIPAVFAIEKSGEYLFIVEGTGFLVYPWVDAKALNEHAISENHALKIAGILAKMHCINLEEPDITRPKFYTKTKENILASFNKAEKFNCPFASSLRKNQDKILAANEDYQNAIPVLKTHLVVSHGDLDQKNVLWDSSNNPILIDWEAACKINSTYDIINTAFYWSGITAEFNKNLFFKMIETYQKAGGVINRSDVVAACYGTFNWMAWLVRNIERSCVKGESELKTVSIKQVNQTVRTILCLQTVIPEIIKNLGGLNIGVSDAIKN
jgi:thiamine kinase-like enzyme